jgi:hypothetical protein
MPKKYNDLWSKKGGFEFGLLKMIGFSKYFPTIKNEYFARINKDYPSEHTSTKLGFRHTPVV